MQINRDYYLLYFSQIITKDNDFIEYLEKRLPLCSNPNVNVEDEIDFLVYYLDTGELVDKKALQKAVAVVLILKSKLKDTTIKRQPRFALPPNSV